MRPTKNQDMDEQTTTCPTTSLSSAYVMVLYEHLDSHNTHLNSINITLCPCLQQNATCAACQEIDITITAIRSVTILLWNSIYNMNQQSRLSVQDVRTQMLNQPTDYALVDLTLFTHIHFWQGSYTDPSNQSNFKTDGAMPIQSQVQPQPASEKGPDSEPFPKITLTLKPSRTPVTDSK